VALEALGFRKVLDAADAAFFPVTSLLFRWVKAEPAADFAALDAFGFRNVRAAAEAVFLPVFSFSPAMIDTSFRFFQPCICAHIFYGAS
jgi:hypothetical protein